MLTGQAVLVDTSGYQIKLAETPEEIIDAQKVRYRVFCLEQGRGQGGGNNGSRQTGLDADACDEHCLHLIAIAKDINEVVGTCRVHLGCSSDATHGFFSADEYEVRGLSNIACRYLEVGRSCIAAHYRGRGIISMLWHGIVRLLLLTKSTCMVGCVSLETADTIQCWAIYDELKRRGRVHSKVVAVPRPEAVIPLPNAAMLPPLPTEEEENFLKRLPPLFKGYLRLGGKICGEPAFDQAFGSIDFFILVAMADVPLRYRRHYQYQTSAAPHRPSGSDGQ